MIRLKSNVFPDALRDYGFVKASELANTERAYKVDRLIEDTEV